MYWGTLPGSCLVHILLTTTRIPGKFHSFSNQDKRDHCLFTPIGNFSSSSPVLGWRNFGTRIPFSFYFFYPTSVSIHTHLTAYRSYINYRFYQITLGGARWRSGLGTTLQTGRSRVRFPTVSLEFFSDTILPVALWLWGRLSL